MPSWLGQLFGAREQRTERRAPEAHGAVRRRGAAVLAALPPLVAGQRDFLPADAGSAASFAAALEPLARCEYCGVAPHTTCDCHRPVRLSRRTIEAVDSLGKYGCIFRRESRRTEQQSTAERRRSAALAVSYGDWRVELPLLVRVRGTTACGPDLQLQLLDVRWGTARECGNVREPSVEDRRTVPETAAAVSDRVAALAFASMLFPDRVSPVTAPLSVLGMLAAAVGLSAGVLAIAATDVHLERATAPRSRSKRRRRAQDEEALQLVLQGAFSYPCDSSGTVMRYRQRSHRPAKPAQVLGQGEHISCVTVQVCERRGPGSATPSCPRRCSAGRSSWLGRRPPTSSTCCAAWPRCCRSTRDTSTRSGRL